MVADTIPTNWRDERSGLRLRASGPALGRHERLNNTLLVAIQAAPLTRTEIVKFMLNSIGSARVDDQFRQELSTELATVCES